MSFIDFPIYSNLNKYVIVGGTAITTNPATTISGSTAFYGVSPGTSITGVYNGGIIRTTAETGPAQTELGTVSDSTPATLMGAINSLTNVLPFPTIVANAVTLQSFTSGQAVRFDAPADLDLSGVAVTFNGPGQFVIHTNTQIIFNSGFTAILAGGALARRIYWYAGTQITNASALTLYGKFISGTLISLDTSTIVNGNLYSNAAVTLKGNTINPEILCFLKKTRILTEHGYKCVDELKVGDNIIAYGQISNNEVLLSYQIEVKPITWISHFYATNHDTSDIPVCFRSGSLGENLPLNDLFVSPGHRIILNSKMCVARDLINGYSIVQEDTNETIEYFHFELDKHIVINAEDVLTETFLEIDNSKKNFQT